MARSNTATRIRSLDEARRALRVPTSEKALLRGGFPVNRVLAVLVDDDTSQEIAAEFAAEIVLAPSGRELGKYDEKQPLSPASVGNRWWIAFGPIVEASDGALVIAQISVGPALGPALARPTDDAFLGVRTGLLRLLSPSHILAEAIAAAGMVKHHQAILEQRGGKPLSPVRARALGRLAPAKAPRAKVSEDDLAAIAAAYVTLYRFRARNPSAEIAGQFGLSREQVRDRIHRAREVGYLKKTKQGRLGAEPGPKLLARWNPPEMDVVNEVGRAAPGGLSRSAEATRPRPT